MLWQNRFVKSLVHLSLLVILILSLGRLMSLIHLFGEKILQIDLAHCYTAGESLKFGLSPYLNHIAHDPPIWDGYGDYQHSRFGYAPLLANFFQLLTLWPYSLVKYLWMGIIILCILGSMIATIKILKIKMNLGTSLILGILILLFYPLQTSLERGQIDALTLFMMMMAISNISDGKFRNFISGVFFSLAAYIKLYCLLIIPFLIIRKKWQVLNGFIFSFVFLLILSILKNGDLVYDYYFNQIPRIAWVSDWGPNELKLPEGTIEQLLSNANAPLGQTVKQGHFYYTFYVPFINHASLVQELGTKDLIRKFYNVLKEWNLIKQGATFVSLGLLAFFILILCFWQKLFLENVQLYDESQEFIYWMVCFIVILLCGVRTWSMNTIWLLPVAVILISEIAYLQSGHKFHIFNFCLCIIGYFFIALPDLPFLQLVDLGYIFLSNKYIIGEILLFISLLGLLTLRVKGFKTQSS